MGNEQCHDSDRKANVNKMTSWSRSILANRQDYLARAQGTAGKREVRSECASSSRPWMWKPACKGLIVDGAGAHSNRRERLGVMVTRIAIPSSNLEISVDRVGKDVMIRLTGRVDVDSSPGLRDRLRTLLSKEALPHTVIVDLAGVPYIETSGIATLIESLRIARHHQIDFRLQGLSGAVLRLFEVTGMLALFEASGLGKKVS
jgi:anti-sigma B factor antagonist